MTRLRWLRWTGTNYEQAAAFLGPELYNHVSFSHHQDGQSALHLCLPNRIVTVTPGEWITHPDQPAPPQPQEGTAMTTTFAEWVILELLGHRRLGGHLTEVTIAGAGFLRLDIPAADGQPPMTQIVNPSSVYAITPTTEDIARRVATLARPAPVSRWELAAAPIHDEDETDEGPF